MIRLLLTLMMVSGGAHSIGYFLTMPIVHKSHTTGECVKVVDYKGAEIKQGCLNMPKKYKLITVY